MKAIVIHEAGGPEKLLYEDVPTPDVKPGWSLVKVKGFGINHSEIFTRKGYSPSVKFPRILGIECVGVIEKSTDEKRLPVGQKVISIMGEMGRAFNGSYAEYALLPNKQIYPVDTDLSWPELAAVPETFFTAYGSFKNLHINSSDKVFVRGATSGVGVAFAKLVKGKFPNIYLAGSSRKLDRADRLKKVGFDEVIVDTDNELQTDEKFTKVLDLIGPKAMKDTFKHVTAGGIVCSSGKLGNQWDLAGFDPVADLAPNSSLTSFSSSNVSASFLNEMLQFIVDHKIDVKPEKVFDLKHVPDAHRFLESGHSFGKVVVINE